MCFFFLSYTLTFLPYSNTDWVAASLTEPAVPQDPTSNITDMTPTYAAYSASGNVTAQVVRYFIEYVFDRNSYILSISLADLRELWRIGRFSVAAGNFLSFSYQIASLSG